MPELIGRDEELAAVERFLTGRRGVLLLEGDAGIGKTSVWEAGLQLAKTEGYRVLSSRAAQAEAHVSFAAIADLLSDARAVFEELAEPQRRALEVALLLRDAEGTPPELASIAFAVLSALRALAAREPVLVALDDAQWLDRPSATALQFALRRLDREQCAALIAARSRPLLDLDRLPADRVVRLPLEGLRIGGLQRLLRARLGVAFPRHVLRRVHELSAGNPFFAIELARFLAARGDQALTGDLPLPHDVHELTRGRLASLPPKTLDALAVAAALHRPTLAVLEAATRADPTRTLRPAADADVAWIDGGEVRFAHPLLARAAYEELGPARRRGVHGRLAELVRDPEERARHLALAAEEADEGVAAALEGGAAAARARGARDAAASLLQEAVTLTPLDSGALVRRAIAASRAYADVGDWTRARILAGRAVDAAAPGAERAEALLQLASCHDDPLAVAERALGEAGDDVALRARVGILLADRRLLTDMASARDDARAAVSDAEAAGDDALLAQALAMSGLMDAGTLTRDPFADLERARALEDSGAKVPLYFSAISSLAIVHLWRDELEPARVLFTELLRRAERGGDDQGRVFPLQHLAMVALRGGEIDEAERCVAAALEAWEASGDPQGLAAVYGSRAHAEAMRGRHDDARATIEEAEALEVDDVLAGLRRRALLGYLALAEERPDDALAALEPLPAALAEAGVREPGIVLYHGDLIEALVGHGRLHDARAVIAQVRGFGRPRMQAWVRRGEGLLAAADGALDDARVAFEAACVSAAPPYEVGRALLELGRVQRRAKRRADARASLERAAAIFERLGSGVWAARVAAERARIGGRAPSPRELTAAEERVANLVAAGRTNKEVAAELFLSVHTVEATLTRVYGKLGVRSRTELAGRFKT